MFVFNRNEWDIYNITNDYCSILLISFIFYMYSIFLTEQEEIEL